MIDDAGLIPLDGKGGGFAGGGDGAGLGGELLAQIKESGEGIVHFAERDKNALAIVSDRFLISGARLAQGGSVAAPGKDG